MSDLERLDEAIEYGEEDVNGQAEVLASLEPWPTLLAAASAYRDLLANGERVWWCEEHNHRGLETVDRCLYAHFTGMKNCRIVPKLLLDPTTTVEPGEET